MPHCTRRPARCTRPSLWVPQEFHSEDTLPPKLRIYAQHANYVMHCVVTRIAFGNKDFAHSRTSISGTSSDIGTVRTSCRRYCRAESCSV